MRRHHVDPSVVNKAIKVAARKLGQICHSSIDGLVKSLQNGSFLTFYEFVNL